MTEVIAMKIPGMDELEKNIAAYNAMRENLERDHFGRIALFHNGQLIATFNDREDAYDIGCDRFGLGNFSLTSIGEEPKSLGSIAMSVAPLSVG